MHKEGGQAVEERKDNRYMVVWICCEFVAFVLWAILIALKAAGPSA